MTIFQVFKIFKYCSIFLLIGPFKTFYLKRFGVSSYKPKYIVLLRQAQGEGVPVGRQSIIGTFFILQTLI